MSSKTSNRKRNGAKPQAKAPETFPVTKEAATKIRDCVIAEQQAQRTRVEVLDAIRAAVGAPAHYLYNLEAGVFAPPPEQPPSPDEEMEEED